MNAIGEFFGLLFIVAGAFVLLDNWVPPPVLGQLPLPRWRRLLPYALMLLGVLFTWLVTPIAHAHGSPTPGDRHATSFSYLDSVMTVIGFVAMIAGMCWGELLGSTIVRVHIFWKCIAAGLLIVVGLLVMMIFGARAVEAQTVRVPDVDARLRLLVEQAAADEWGVDASPARLAAQLHQESSWNPKAQSSVGAEGLAQIMPATGKWLAQQFPQIGTYDPWDAAWSARAAAVYDHWLLQRNQGAGACSSWAFAFSAYNGGETLLHREQTIAAQHGKNAKRWFDNTANYSARSRPNWQQNRDYVRRILIVLEPAYIKAGWSGTAVCV
jgi:hypothetical protein